MRNAGTANFSLWQDFLLLLGRVLMGWIYVESGWRKLTGMDAFIASLVNRHVPYATLIGHRYWELTDAALRRMQQSHFAKNVTIIGGLVLLFVTGAGRFSVDGWRKRGWG